MEQQLICFRNIWLLAEDNWKINNKIIKWWKKQSKYLQFVSIVSVDKITFVTANPSDNENNPFVFIFKCVKNFVNKQSFVTHPLHWFWQFLLRLCTSWMIWIWLWCWHCYCFVFNRLEWFLNLRNDFIDSKCLVINIFFS